MRSFYQFLEVVNFPVTVDVKKYKDSVWKLLSNLSDFTQSEKERLSYFKFDRSIIVKNLQHLQYPGSKELLLLVDKLISGEVSGDKLIELSWGLFEEERKLDKWISSLPWQSRNYDVVRAIDHELRDLQDKIYHDERGYAKEEPDEETLQKLIVQTSINMQKIAQKIQEVISRIENWNGSSVVVEAPEQDKDSNWLEPEVGSARVELNHPENTNRWSAGFAYWEHENEKVQIEDVLEAGDNEFFTSAKLQEDYFNLINELRRPGSASQGKNISVYTARPKQDRELYLKAEETKQIPANLFVTSGFENAVDLMQDLPGDKDRDVWKIRINSKYLILTNDDGRIKHYQVKGTGMVPVVSISLIYTSDQP